MTTLASVYLIGWAAAIARFIMVEPSEGILEDAVRAVMAAVWPASVVAAAVYWLADYAADQDIDR